LGNAVSIPFNYCVIVKIGPKINKQIECIDIYIQIRCVSEN
jgi:hypothetical protein